MKRYNEALVLMINHIDENLVLAGDIGLSNLARHLLLKELTG